MNLNTGTDGKFRSTDLLMSGSSQVVLDGAKGQDASSKS